MRAKHLLPEMLIGWKTPAPPPKHKQGWRTNRNRRIPQETIRAMRAEYEAIPVDANGHKPRGCYKRLADKYHMSRLYAYNVLTMGLRDDEREDKNQSGELMETKHPAAVAAESLAVAKAAQRKVEKQEEEQYTKDFGLRFVHIRARGSDNRPLPNAGCTIAYNFAGAGRDRVNVAVATCHKIDAFSKPVGRLQAAKNFAKGAYITLRVPKGLSPVQMLQAAFYWSAQSSVTEWEH